MNYGDNSKEIATVGAVILFLIGFAVVSGVASFGDVLPFAFFLGLVIVGAKVLNDKKLDQIFNGEGDGDSAESVTEEKVREKVKAWADRNYTGYNSADFDWSNAETGETYMADFGDNDRRIKYIRYYYTSLGPLNQDVLIFWNSSDNPDGPMDHKRVREGDLEDPFWQCSQYQDWVRSGRPMPHQSDDSDSGQPIQVFGGNVGPGGLPENQGQGGDNS